MRHSKSTFPVADALVGTSRWQRHLPCDVSTRKAGGTCVVGRSTAHVPPGLRAVTAQRAVPTILSAILLFIIKLYRWTISPAQVFLFGGGSGCRFTPTCSQYAAEAIRRHGALAGSLMAAKRICRCHPLGDCGYDPVPKSREKEAEAPLISNG